MQPDAAARFTAFDVQDVGIVQRHGPGAIKLIEHFGVEVAGDVVHAQGRALVAFLALDGAGLAHRNIVVRRQLQAAGRVGKQVQARAGRINGNGSAGLLREFQKLARYRALGRAIFDCLNPAQGFVPKLGEHHRASVGRRWRYIAHGFERAGARCQQIAIDQLGELKVGHVAHQFFGQNQRPSWVALGHELVDL